MAEKAPTTFEEKVGRLEQIAKQLEGGDVDLDAAVALFKEGKELARQCEEMLKKAQGEIDRAMQQKAAPDTALDEDIPF